VAVSIEMNRSTMRKSGLVKEALREGMVVPGTFGRVLLDGFLCHCDRRLLGEILVGEDRCQLASTDRRRHVDAEERTMKDLRYATGERKEGRRGDDGEVANPLSF
jgi:hypothetical protein